MPNFSGKKLLLAGFILVLLAVIPLTVYLLQQQQETRTQAIASTKLFFAPPSSSSTPISVNVDDSFTLNVMMDPGQNEVSFTKLVIAYDDTKIATVSAGTSCGSSFCVDPGAFSVTGDGPAFGNGTITVTLSVGADPTKLIQTQTKIATLTFKAIASTGATPTKVSYNRGPSQTTVLSANRQADRAEENVLSSADSAFIITAGNALTSPTATPTVTASPTATPSASSIAPVCTSLTTDTTASGSAPLTLAFTTNGFDTDGNISKVTFNFGDGPVVDVTSGGGVGTATVSAKLSHTYNTGGSYVASAILTDNSGTISSASAACSKNIAVAESSVTPTSEPTATPTFEPTATPTKPPIVLSPMGPGDAIVGVGLVGVLLAFIGGLLFFAL